MINHGKRGYQVQEGDWIGQMIIAKTGMPGMMEVDSLPIPDPEKKGFGRTDLSAKRTITMEQVQPITCQLYADSWENRLFTENHIRGKSWLLQEEVMVSSAMISKAILQEYELGLLEEVREVSKDDLD